MILLRLITWPYVRRHLTRALLTTLGIVLGVAVFVAMYTANQAVLRGLEQTVDRVAGKTQLQVTAGDAGFPEDVLEKVQAVPEVMVAVPVIEATLETGLPGQGNLLVLAVDMTGDRSLRDYDLESGDDAVIDDPLVFLAQPDSLMVTDEFAKRNGLHAGSTIVLGTMLGNQTFTIRGIMKPTGLGSAFGGNLAIMDIYAAQQVFGRGRTFDRIDLALRDDVTLDQGRAAIERALGPGFEVAPPSSRGRQFESIVQAYSISMNISSLFALFIGMFIIYNSFSIAVTQRRADIGILRALGAFRSQIRTLFLVEGAVAGLVGSAVGCVAGLGMGRALVGEVATMLEGVFGIVQQPAGITLTPGLLLFALVVGVATSVVAAYIPARQAARVDPVQALQKGRYQVLTAGQNRARRRVALVMAAASAALLWLGHSDVPFYAGYLLAILAALLLTPTLARLLAEALRPVLRWLRPVEGTLAADSLLQAPRRTSGTVAALMLALAQVIALGGTSLASYAGITDWVDTALNPDLFVTADPSLAVRTFRFPASMGPELRSIEGVDEVQQVRSVRVPFRGGPILVVSVEVGGLAHRARREPVAGDADEMYRLAGEGKGVMVSENLADLRGLRLGETIALATPAGMLRLPIVGIVEDWSDQLGTILLDRKVFIRQWRDDSVEHLPHLPEAGRVGGRREGAHLREVRGHAPPLRPDQPRGAQLHHAPGRPVGGHDQRPGRRRGPRGDPRHRQHADRVDPRPAAGARRAAGRGRPARPDPAYDLDGGRDDQRDRPRARPRVRRRQPALHPGDHEARHRRHEPRLHVPGVDRPRHHSDDARGGVRVGPRAGRVGRAGIAGGSAGI